MVDIWHLLTGLWSWIAAFPWTWLLQGSALILSIVNGLMLLKSYLQDRPKLVVKPIHPEVYQWFFRLPSGMLDGHQTKKFGFLAYLEICNKGLRDVAVGGDICDLLLNIYDGKIATLKPLSIPEPRITLGRSRTPKAYQVLGIKGEFSTGETMVKSGDTLSGFAYFIFEYWGWDEWDLVSGEGTIIGTIVVTDVFGNKTSTQVVFKEISLDRARAMVSDIDTIDSESSDSNS
jgi:hypothetical protein